MRAAFLAVLLLAPPIAEAQDRAVDAPTLAAPPRPVTLTTLSPLELPLAAGSPTAAAPALAVSPALAPNLALAPAAPIAPAAPTAALQPSVPAPLPASAVPASVTNAAAGCAFGVSGAGGGLSRPAEAGSAESLLAAGAFFDNALSRAEALTAFPAAAGGTPAAVRYEQAASRAETHGWKDHAGAVTEAASALLAERGVKASRGRVTLNGESYDAVTIAPERGLSPLNDLAYELHSGLGTSMDFIPERTAGASAAYNAKANRLMLAGLDRPDFYLAALHEARHAWYSALLRRGDIRLFHLQVVARPGRSVAPGAETYAGYVSFEELSTFPKTLKHMLTERAKLSGEAAAFLEDRLAVRALQFADILKSAAFVSRQLQAMTLAPRRMSAEELAPTALQQVDGLDVYEQPLPQGWAYFSVPFREKKVLGFKSAKSSAKEARAALRLRGELIEGLVDASAPALVEYHRAVKARDWSAASAAADRLIKAARDAEAAWSARSPHKQLKD